MLFHRDNQCDLINMSLGGGPPSQAEQDAIRDAAQRGTLCICSAGNEKWSDRFSRCLSRMCCRFSPGLNWCGPPDDIFGIEPSARTAKLDSNISFLAAFSCFGPTLACIAPESASSRSVPDHLGAKDLYMEMDGTSMASPAACGTLAVILSKDTTYKALPRDISRTNAARTLLAHTATDRTRHYVRRARAHKGMKILASCGIW